MLIDAINIGLFSNPIGQKCKAQDRVLKGPLGGPISPIYFAFFNYGA